MEHTDTDKGHKKTKKSHNASHKPKMSKSMPMTDIDEEMGNTKGMCKMVSGKS